MSFTLHRPPYVLPAIVFAQFAGTSLWFAGNAVVGLLPPDWGIGESELGYVTTSVQLGFVVGTLLFAFFGIADRFSPSNVFLVCTFSGALTTLALVWIPPSLDLLLVLRFGTGFFLAGIYPVGMKIAASWFQEGLGRALGYLVGALVLGTAFPHLLATAGSEVNWHQVLWFVSLLAATGGLVIRIGVADGPHLPKGSPFNPNALRVIFQSREFRASAFGYFGHMWELCAFWAFLPVWLAAAAVNAGTELNISLWVFWVIAAGSLGCAGGGYLVAKFGSARVAGAQLLISGLCCLLSPLLFSAPVWLLLAFLVVWGVTVVGDSPQFSTLNAQTAPTEYVGSALTIANSLGFFITVLSIQLIDLLTTQLEPRFWLCVLVLGPVFGINALRRVF